MGLEEGKRGGKQAAFARAVPELIWGQSGKVKEPSGTSFVGERCCQCGEGEFLGIARRVICGVA